MGFFDDLTKKASETYKNTAEKTNKLTREMKLKSLINDDKSKIEKIYGEIGKKVYEKHIREENIDIKSELAEECAQIDAYAKEIEDMRLEILSLKDLRLCKTCAAEIPLTAKFCPKCGTVQEEVTPAAQNTTVNEAPAVAEAPVVESVPVQEPVVTVEPVEAAVEEPATEVQVTEEQPVENSTEENN